MRERTAPSESVKGDGYTVSVTKPGYIHLDQRFVRKHRMEWAWAQLLLDEEDKMTVSFIRRPHLDLDEGLLPIILTSDGFAVHIKHPYPVDAILDAYAGTSLPFQFANADMNAIAFTIERPGVTASSSTDD